MQGLDKWPIKLTLGAMSFCRYSFVGMAVSALESSAPEIVARMMESVLSRPDSYARITDTQFKVSGHGGKERVFFDVTDREQRLRDAVTFGTDNQFGAFASVPAVVLASADHTAAYTFPFCRELPTGILEVCVADPTAALALRYRLYIQHQFVPCLRKITGLLDAHAAVVDLPPTEWMKSKFPEENWVSNTASIYQHFFIAHLHAWEAVLRAWDIGRFDIPEIGPAHFPFSGLAAINEWSMLRAEARQRELIGVTTEYDAPVKSYGGISESASGDARPYADL
eukprot:SAG31_NODE_474_length_15176_cov_7.362340_1_plen_281_part_10